MSHSLPALELKACRKIAKRGHLNMYLCCDFLELGMRLFIDGTQTEIDFNDAALYKQRDCGETFSFGGNHQAIQ